MVLLLLTLLLAAAAPLAAQGTCFYYDSASRSGPSGLCKPDACNDALAIPAYRSLDACCAELVKMLSWQNQAACVAKSAEVFKVQGGGGGGGARFIQKKDADIESADLKNGEAYFHRVCGPVSAVEAECAKTQGCVAFTYEASPRPDGNPQCGYLKGDAKGVKERKGWDVYFAAPAGGGGGGGGAKFAHRRNTDIKGADLKSGEAYFHRVCGPVSAVEAECAKMQGCVAFTYEASPRPDGNPQCGYLKGDVKAIGERKGWDLYVRQ